MTRRKRSFTGVLTTSITKPQGLFKMIYSNVSELVLVITHSNQYPMNSTTLFRFKIYRSHKLLVIKVVTYQFPTFNITLEMEHIRKFPLRMNQTVSPQEPVTGRLIRDTLDRTPLVWRLYVRYKREQKDQRSWLIGLRVESNDGINHEQNGKYWHEWTS